MQNWLEMTPEDFDADARMVQGALFAAPVADSLFSIDELSAE